MKEQNQNTHQPQHHPSADHIQLPKRDRAKTVWMIVAIVAIAALIGLGVFGYYKIKNLNKQLQDQQAQINDLSNTKKTLEDAASAAAKSAVNATANAITNSNNYIEIKELGFKLPLTDDIKDLQYFVNDKTVFFSSKSLMSSAWAADSGNAAKYCSPGVLPFGAITRFANASEAGPTQQKNLGSFVLGYAPPQSYCSDNAATTTLQNKQKAALLNAFNNAQKL